MRLSGTLTWDIVDVARSLKIREEDVKEYFTDGRRVAFLIERRIMREVIGGRLAPSEGAAFDLIDPEGGKWEVRSISSSGVYFCPSYMVGSGRSFNERGFLRKLDEIRGYVVSDIESFPTVPYWMIRSAEVRDWWSRKSLGANSKVSRDKALRLIKGLP